MKHFVRWHTYIYKEVGLAVEIDVGFSNPFDILSGILVVLTCQFVGLKAEVGLLSLAVALHGQAVAPSTSDVVEGDLKGVVAALGLILSVAFAFASCAGYQQ